MKPIKLFEPTLTDEGKKAILDTLDSGIWDAGEGPKVKLFEQKLKEYLGCHSVVCTNSCTAALHMSLSLFEEDIVNTTSLSFVSTANSALYNNKKLIFYDIDKKTLNLKTPDIYFKNSITLPVHFSGLPCVVDVDTPIVEDCAHAMGSKLTTKNIKCFSFYPTKNLSTLKGGCIALYDNKHVEELKEMRWCGISNRKGSDYDVKRLGYNYYMNEVSASLGIVNLKNLDNNNRKRYEIAKRYHEELNYDMMPLSKDCSYHMFWILSKDRKRLRKLLERENIESGTHYRPIDTFQLYKKQKLPITDRVGKEIVTLPIHPNLSENDVNKIIQVINSI